MFELVDNVPQSAVIKVIGVGGGGDGAGAPWTVGSPSLSVPSLFCLDAPYSSLLTMGHPPSS